MYFTRFPNFHYRINKKTYMISVYFPSSIDNFRFRQVTTFTYTIKFILSVSQTERNVQTQEIIEDIGSPPF